MFDQADLLIKNVLVFNSYFKKFYPADVAVLDGRILDIHLDPKQGENRIKASEILDGGGLYMVPGLIDIHMHIESSMMTPKAFTQKLVSCGVTTIVSEPHEMANVNGVQGILDMIEDGKDAPIDIYYGIPSCVPSTSPSLETTGGILDYKDMKALLDHKSVACIGEIMNYRQVIRDENLDIVKLLHYLRENCPDYVIEGHCPALADLDLSKFLYLGINGDHTEHSLEGLKQRFFNGMYIELQKKMLNREVLDFIEENHLYEYFGFVTDDVMADTLCEKGHLDVLVREAIRLGLKPEQAIYNATFTNAGRMHFTDRGAIAPGKLADFILLDDLPSFAVSQVYKNGACIYRNTDHTDMKNIVIPSRFPESYYHSVKLLPLTQSVFQIRSEQNAETAKVRVIQVKDKSTRTGSLCAELPVAGGKVQWQNSPYLLAAVLERYGKNQGIGYGFVTGDTIKHGAVATTYAHDHHNLLVVGSNMEDMTAAANCVIEMQGGIAVSDHGVIQASLRLDVGGILSDQPADLVGLGLAKIRQALTAQGCSHNNPIMSLCTISLPVSPALKLTDKGLIDVQNSAVVPLFMD